MSRFTKNNFNCVIREIENAETADENIWIAVGILEMMYDDDCGYIDQYFHSSKVKRDKEDLWAKLQGHIIYNQLK